MVLLNGSDWGLFATRQDETVSYMLPFDTAKDNQMPPVETKICTLIIVAYSEVWKHGRMLARKSIWCLSHCPVVWATFEKSSQKHAKS